MKEGTGLSSGCRILLHKVFANAGVEKKRGGKEEREGWGGKINA